MTRTRRVNPQIQELQPLRRESWVEQTADKYLENIRALSIDATSYRYVAQGSTGILSPAAFTELFRQEPRPARATGPVEHMGSEGFGSCSAMLVHDPKTDIYLLSHLEPLDWNFLWQANSGGLRNMSWNSTRVILVYGSLSWEQTRVEHFFLDGRRNIGDMSVIQVETGSTAWHASFEAATGVLSVVREVPDQSIFHYQAVPPQ